jgi:hypothetical protein
MTLFVEFLELKNLLDRGGAPDLSVSGDNFDLVGDDPHDLTTTSETRSANAIAEPTPNAGARSA